MKTQFVLYNPTAAGGKGEEAARRLDAVAPGKYIYQDITQISDFRAYVESLPEKSRLIICGGDGTLNRFINATLGMNLEDRVSYFAAGSGNDFWRDIDRKRKDGPVLMSQYLKQLPTVHVQGKDYAFINAVGYGIDGYCCEVGDRQRQKTKRPVKYSAIAVKGVLGGYKPPKATVCVDGVQKEYKKVWLAAAMFGRYYGCGMMAAPRQDRKNSDGTVSLVVLHSSGRLKTLRVFPSIFKGEHVAHKELADVITGHEISVKFSCPTALQIDGETILNVTEYRVTSARAPSNRMNDSDISLRRLLKIN